MEISPPSGYNTIMQRFLRVVYTTIFTPPTSPSVSTLHGDMKSFADLMGFGLSNSTAKLGILAESQTIREAIVAVSLHIRGRTHPHCHVDWRRGDPNNRHKHPICPIAKELHQHSYGPL